MTLELALLNSPRLTLARSTASVGSTKSLNNSSLFNRLGVNSVSDEP